MSNGPYREYFTYYKPQQYTGKMRSNNTNKRSPVVNTALNLVVEQNEEEQCNSRNLEYSPQILSYQKPDSHIKPPLSIDQQKSSGTKKPRKFKDLNEMRSMRDLMRKSQRFQSQHSQYSAGSQLQNIIQIQNQIQELEESTIIEGPQQTYPEV